MVERANPVERASCALVRGRPSRSNSKMSLVLTSSVNHVPLSPVSISAFACCSTEVWISCHTPCVRNDEHSSPERAGQPRTPEAGHPEPADESAPTPAGRTAPVAGKPVAGNAPAPARENAPAPARGNTPVPAGEDAPVLAARGLTQRLLGQPGLQDVDLPL